MRSRKSSWLYCHFMRWKYSAPNVLFIIVSAILVAGHKSLHQTLFNTEKITINADILVGMTALETKDINNMHSQGRVFVQGQNWATCANTDATIHLNGYVRIDDIQGVTLCVHLVASEDFLNAETAND